MLSLGRGVNHVFLLKRSSNRSVLFKGTWSLHQIVDGNIFVFLEFLFIVFVFILLAFHFEKCFKDLMIFIKSFLLLLRLLVSQKLLLFFFQLFLFLFSIILNSSIIKCLKLKLSFLCVFKVHKRVLENYLLHIRVVLVPLSLDFVEILVLLNVFMYLTLLTNFSQFYDEVSHVVEESCFEFLCDVTEVFLLEKEFEGFSLNYRERLFFRGFL